MLKFKLQLVLKCNLQLNIEVLKNTLKLNLKIKINLYSISKILTWKQLFNKEKIKCWDKNWILMNST